jgi:hypothetical protein
MQLKMPGLNVGKIYHESDVKHLFVDHGGGSTDWGRVKVRFPWRLDDLRSDDMEKFRRDDEMVVQYTEAPIAELSKQIHGLQRDFSTIPEERRRIDAIKATYAGGELVFPVFVQSNDPQQRICEGMHRAVALLECGAETIPMFRTGYRDWF